MKIDNLEDIKDLMARNENEQVEFKETTGQLECCMDIKARCWKVGDAALG